MKSRSLKTTVGEVDFLFPYLHLDGVEGENDLGVQESWGLLRPGLRHGHERDLLQIVHKHLRHLETTGLGDLEPHDTVAIRREREVQVIVVQAFGAFANHRDLAVTNPVSSAATVSDRRTNLCSGGTFRRRWQKLDCGTS